MQKILSQWFSNIKTILRWITINGILRRQNRKSNCRMDEKENKQKFINKKIDKGSVEAKSLD